MFLYLLSKPFPPQAWEEFSDLETLLVVHVLPPISPVFRITNRGLTGSHGKEPSIHAEPKVLNHGHGITTALAAGAAHCCARGRN